MSLRQLKRDRGIADIWANRSEASGGMSVVQIEKQIPGRDVPRLDPYELERLDATEAEELLVARFRAFGLRGLGWKLALLLAVTPDIAR